MNLIQRREQILSNVKQIDELVNMYNEIVNKMDAPIVSVAIMYLQHNIK